MGDVIAIRPATPDDVDVIEGMWQELAAQHGTYDAGRWDFAPDAGARWRKAFVESMKLESTLVRVAEDGRGRRLGFLWATMGDATPQMAYRRMGTINDLFVVPGGRCRGIGGRLVTAAAEELKRRGAECLTLLVATANERAIGFYKRLGMKASSQQMFMRL